MVVNAKTVPSPSDTHKLNPHSAREQRSIGGLSPNAQDVGAEDGIRPLSGVFPVLASFPNKMMIQTKLTVGAPDDVYEQEADAMADRVVQGADAGAGEPLRPVVPGIQRKCAACQEEEKVQRKPLPITPLIQAKGAGQGNAHPQVQQGIAATRGGGMTLDGASRQQMEQGFGHDFSAVRIHTSDYAAQMSRDLNARAFTVGNDIYFNRGEYQPGTKSGQHLLAHELTHTVQQGGGGLPRIQRLAWDAAGSNCGDVDSDRWLRSVVVHQEMPQYVTLNWDNGTSESAITSTGKGLCCGDNANDVACDAATSTSFGTDCTPLTTGIGYAIRERKLNHNGYAFWNTFVPHRGIALHTHPTVKGEPLSHGCVRLNETTARRIFCGARKDQTRVMVEGFARPYCQSSNLQAEWMADFAYAQIDPTTAPRDVRAGITDIRAGLRKGFGTRTEGELDTTISGITTGNVGASIPRCRSSAPQVSPANATAEEQRLQTQAPVTSPFQLVFASDVIALAQALRASADFAAAQTAVATAGQDLWNHALERANPPTGGPAPDIDDRPLYWARLRMVQEIRSFTPSYTISATQRQQLVDSMDAKSRGHDSVSFAGAADGQKRILISGFDPFGMGNAGSGGGGTNNTIRDSNPSGAAVLALNGTTITGEGGLSAYVQGVLFPVRYRDFDAGMVEGVFGRFLTGPLAANMIMTISQGGSTFDVENTAGRNRSTAGFADNEGVITPGTPSAPVAPTIGPGAETYNTTLPHSQMTAGGLSTLKTSGATMTSGPSPMAVTGTGGGFLSNEIFYRVRRLQVNMPGGPSTIPMGHLHVPDEDVMTRESIRDRIKAIIAAALPGLP